MCVCVCVFVTQCCVALSAGDLSEKTTIYSTLVGILNARKMEVGEEVRIPTKSAIVSECVFVSTVI